MTETNGEGGADHGGNGDPRLDVFMRLAVQTDKALELADEFSKLAFNAGKARRSPAVPDPDAKTRAADLGRTRTGILHYEIDLMLDHIRTARRRLLNTLQWTGTLENPLFSAVILESLNSELDGMRGDLAASTQTAESYFFHAGEEETRLMMPVVTQEIAAEESLTDVTGELVNTPEQKVLSALKNIFEPNALGRNIISMTEALIETNFQLIDLSIARIRNTVDYLHAIDGGRPKLKVPQKLTERLIDEGSESFTRMKELSSRVRRYSGQLEFYRNALE